MPFPNAPKPVVDDEPKATILNVPPGRSFALVSGQWGAERQPAGEFEDTRQPDCAVRAILGGALTLGATAVAKLK